MTTYRLLAKSIIHPGNYLLEAPDGECYIYFADIGELCATALDHSLAEAMMQSYEWAAIDGGEWVTLSDLQTGAAQSSAPGNSEADLTQPET